MRLTQAVAREYLRRLGLRLRRNAEYGEYVLVIPEGKLDGKHEVTTLSFHTDLDDIVGTARIVRGSHENFQEAENFLQKHLTSC
jgi:hypothetical protein